MKLALKRKAQVMLLMTWGYLEGDKKEHRAIFPDYHAMQVAHLPKPVHTHSSALDPPASKEFLKQLIGPQIEVHLFAVATGTPHEWLPCAGS